MILFGSHQYSSDVPPLLGVGKLIPPAAFDDEGWQKASLREKMRMGVSAWVDHGFGAPAIKIYSFYLLKHWMWFSAWRYFASFGTAAAAAAGGGGSPLTLFEMVASHDAMMRLVIWNLLFESLGFGCASGALTGRFTLPSAAMFHWFWVGSMKLPFRLNGITSRQAFIPGVGNKRTVLDVALYCGFILATLNALTNATIGFTECIPIVATLVTLGFLDYTIFLAARSEVYLYIVVCYLFVDSNVALDDVANAHVWTAAKCCQLAIWMWAAVSKFGEWFPYVVAVLICNSPIFPFTLESVHNAMYKDPAKSDFRVSDLCWRIAHFGTISELMFPLLLMLNGAAFHGDVLGSLGLFICFGFHTFIFFQIAMGAPQEWNLFSMMNAAFLFGRDGGLSVSAVEAVPLGLKVFLAIFLIGVPLVGNFFPAYVSFLPAMRYYAGNWPQSCWVIKRSALHKLDKIQSACGSFYDQAWMLYGDRGVRHMGEAMMVAWLSQHLQGRLLPKLIPKAMGKDGKLGNADDDYQVVLGELLAGSALGYNFGDGFLHGPYFLNAVQELCQFEEGECVQIFISSCALGDTKYPWFINDATSAYVPVDFGHGDVHVLKNTQPY